MKVTVLIGEMGSGKSHVGRWIAEQAGAEFIEGDDLCPPEMAEAIRHFKLISKEMIDDLVENLARNIWARKIEGKRGDIVVSQALYREDHRRNLTFLLNRFHVDVEFVWVRVGFLRHLRQLWSRPRGLRWVLYWLLSKPFFQRPRGFHRVLRNDRQLP